MVSTKQIASHVGLDTSTIRQAYIYKESKKNHLDCLRVGTYLALNNISDDELVAMVSAFKASKQLILDKIK